MAHGAPRLIVTRPAAQATAWLEALRRAGVEAQGLPLLGIEPVDTPEGRAALRAAWQALPQAALVMFVSANAVAGFAAARPADAAWPPGLRAGSTGPGTSAALREVGWGPVIAPPDDAPRFDTEALWALLREEPWAGRSVWVVRGEQGRDWLADTLRRAGATVNFVAAYRRVAPLPDADGEALLARALAEPACHAWHFSSSEAIGHLRTLRPHADWSDAEAWCSHPRIAEAARAAGFGRVREVPVQAEAVAALWHAVHPRTDGRAAPARVDAQDGEGPPPTIRGLP